MRGRLNDYFDIFKAETIKGIVSFKLASLIIILTLSIGGAFYSNMLYGKSYIFYGIILTAVPGVVFVFYTAFLTHLVLKFFSKKAFISTLIPFSFATIPAIFSFLPFVYYFCVLIAFIVLLKGLCLLHHIKWYKSLFAIIIVALLNYFLIMWIGFLFGGAV
jgi:hypothetical protein